MWEELTDMLSLTWEQDYDALNLEYTVRQE